MIEVKGLKKAFGENDVLNGIDTVINKGEKVVVIGPSGSGKSTFLRCLNRLETPTGGSVVFEGTDITNLPEKQLNKIREKMGMVFQHFHLFPHLSIRKNLTLAPVKLKLMTKEEADKRADEMLKKVGLFDKADSYPDMLSGGQK